MRTGATFADAAAEWLRYVEEERGRKASTLADYRSVVNAHRLLLNRIFKRARKVWRLPHNPVADVERLTVPKRTDVAFYSPEEVHALARGASSEQDAAMFLTAALTGLRMGELFALRWRDVDFAAQCVRVTASYTAGKLGTPKSGLGRAVPLMDEVARALARIGERDRWVAPEDLVFSGATGEPLDGSALEPVVLAALRKTIAQRR